MSFWPKLRNPDPAIVPLHPGESLLWQHRPTDFSPWSTPAVFTNVFTPMIVLILGLGVGRQLFFSLPESVHFLWPIAHYAVVGVFLITLANLLRFHMGSAQYAVTNRRIIKFGQDGDVAREVYLADTSSPTVRSHFLVRPLKTVHVPVPFRGFVRPGESTALQMLVGRMLDLWYGDVRIIGRPRPEHLAALIREAQAKQVAS